MDLKVVFVLALMAIGLILLFRSMKGGYTANANAFSQAGVTVDFIKRVVIIGGRQFNPDQITHIRTQDKPGVWAAHDCVISIRDYGLPEHKIRFASESAANKFMQRLCTATEQAGGPRIR